jgi:hypothetical protein
MVCWVPYTTVIPDLVPLPQRAAASGWQARAPGSTLSCVVASETLSPLVIPRASVITTSHHQ